MKYKLKANLLGTTGDVTMHFDTLDGLNARIDRIKEDEARYNKKCNPQYSDIPIDSDTIQIITLNNGCYL